MKTKQDEKEVPTNRNKPIFKKVPARKTDLVELSIPEATLFIEEHHRSGAIRGDASNKALGITFQGELVGVALFGLPRTSRKQRQYGNELLRLAFKDGIRVQGGASKLIKGFIKRYSPNDLFTYQDRTGEATSVYENAGMTLVEERKEKKLLLAPGVKFAEASRKELLGIPYASKYGPDRILGTNLGEEFREDGSRKSNIELFQELGWTLVTVPGDRVYEWINPNRTYYCYKITSADSSKYYYGVTHLKKAQASMEECQAHPYFGSGRTKYNNWKEKHQKSLQKEVLKTFRKEGEAYEYERKLVGEKYKNDPNCLNSTTGGKRKGVTSLSLLVKECPIHGLSKHRGKSCQSCVEERLWEVSDCPVHGETKHRAGLCQKCVVATEMKECPIHGLSKHRGKNCYQCSSLKGIEKRVCKVHGMTLHRGGVCYKCSTDSSFTQGECPIHGVVTFRGSQCEVCSAEKKVTVKICPIHGETKHLGQVCYACRTSSMISLKNCKEHGMTKHQGDACFKCASKKAFSMENCQIHGLVKHSGGKCFKCVVADSITLKECPIHGLVKHRGESCYSCRGVKAKRK